jgi:sugar-phosphatase
MHLHPIANSSFEAFLFDMDGTLLSSLVSGERIWSRWFEKHGLDPKKYLPTIHGSRSVDTIARLGLPGVDPAAEANAITQAEIVDTAGVVEITGAKQFLAGIPKGKWAVVTSAPRALAEARFRAAGIALPEVVVSAESVQLGKPNPACFLLGAKLLGVSAKECLVFEDTAVGIKAGEGAGAKVLLITATHSHPLEASTAKAIDYSRLKVVAAEPGRFKIIET